MSELWIRVIASVFFGGLMDGEENVPNPHMQRSLIGKRSSHQLLHPDLSFGCAPTTRTTLKSISWLTG
jgi:hypothetical protein